MEGARAKKTYRIKHKLQAFYSGGAARVTSDGKLVACACGEEVKIVELSTGAVTKTLAGDSEPITALAVSPDCQALVCASRSLLCKTYDLASGAVLRSFRAHKAPIADMAFDASAGYIATASADRTVKVWDAKGGFATHNFVGHSGVVLRVVWHPRQLQLFSSGDDTEVRIWDLVDKSCVAVLKGHFSAVTSLALSSDGWLLLSGGRDKVVHVWDIRNKTKLATVPIYEAVEGVVSLPQGCGFPGVEAAAAPEAGTVVSRSAKKAVFFATAGEKGVIKVWRSDTAACVYTQPPPVETPTGALAAGPAAGSEYVDLALLPGGAGLLVCSADARLMVYSPEEVAGKAALTMSLQLIGNHDEVTDLRFLGPAGEPTHLAVATNSEAVRLFRLSNLSCTASLLGHRDIVLCLDSTVLPGGRCLVASGSKDAEVRVWESPSGRCLGHGVGHIGAVSAVAFSRKAATPAAQRFMVSAGADKLLKVWDLAPAIKEEMAAGAGTVALRVTAAVAAHDKDINTVAVAPNDTLVATGSQDRTARVWRLPDLVPVVTLRGHKRGVWSVEFSPVDKALLTASGDKTIKLWNLVDGACLKTFEGHTASVLRATYATGGTQVLSCGADGLVKLWGIRDSECVGTFDEHQDKIWALTTAGGGEALIATGGADALVAIWQDVTVEDAALAEEREEELAEKEQRLRNALVANNFAEAARLAFDLKHPGRLLSVLSRLAGGAGGASAVLLSGLASHLSPADLKTALEYVREWNTNAKHCHAAHALMRAVLRHHTPDTLLALPGAPDLVAGVLAYSQRHFTRLDRLVRSTFLLDYTLDSMRVLRAEGLAGQAALDLDAADAAAAALDDAADGGVLELAPTEGRQVLGVPMDASASEGDESEGDEDEEAVTPAKAGGSGRGTVGGRAGSGYELPESSREGDEEEDEEEEVAGGSGGRRESGGVAAALGGGESEDDFAMDDAEGPSGSGAESSDEGDAAAASDEEAAAAEASGSDGDGESPVREAPPSARRSGGKAGGAGGAKQRRLSAAAAAAASVPSTPARERQSGGLATPAAVTPAATPEPAQHKKGAATAVKVSKATAAAVAAGAKSAPPKHRAVEAAALVPRQQPKSAGKARAATAAAVLAAEVVSTPAAKLAAPGTGSGKKKRAAEVATPVVAVAKSARKAGKGTPAVVAAGSKSAGPLKRRKVQP